MQPHIQQHLIKVLDHLYINPLEKCNLRCQICYTRKTNPILSNDQILAFISRYQAVHPLKTITFCGGEVFALKAYPSLVNTLTSTGLFVQMITNGTLDRLHEFTAPNFINLIVSLDGLKAYHDANRGEGNFKKSLNFLKKAHTLGFHTDIFSIVTQQNYPQIDAFESYLKHALGFLPVITYHPRKPPTYLTHHPFSNIEGTIPGFDYLTSTQMLEIIDNRNVFPPKDLGCYQIALVSDGRVFGCCEGTLPIGNINTPIKALLEVLESRLQTWEKTTTLRNCLGCSQPDFVCGIKQYLEMLQKDHPPGKVLSL